MSVIPLENLNDEAFSEYGKVISIPEPGSRKPLLESSFFKHYGPLAFLDCNGPTEFGITTFTERELSINQLEQHVGTPELLYAIDGDMIIPTAPIITVDGEVFPDESRIKAFLVRQGQGVVFNEGQWHWAPFPYGKKVSSVLVGFAVGTATTNIVIKDLTRSYSLNAGV